MTPTTVDIIKAIAEHLGLSLDDLDRKTLLGEDLNLGPIELNDLLNYLSKKFEISLPPDETENLSKVEDVIVLVEDNLIG